MPKLETTKSKGHGPFPFTTALQQAVKLSWRSVPSLTRVPNAESTMAESWRPHPPTPPVSTLLQPGQQLLPGDDPGETQGGAPSGGVA